ncbi:DUF427 domain-containing protein [filamentous cyanobacterium LEGE 11480]|uniref:DUF427 domain-containing protein n=1 Tax=Romeriopsis navalis LEGE 11480 TaxID=2777977 RepID=A0A928VN11_9CYAN|nr:DUF427 domain-containing protein [Romeriopsis navalis]MBE9028964.1 DUF427 domain-containing protein [Romeriopsis navalis LEGE 11480]
MHPKPHPIQTGQESVWDYPRPPQLEATTKHIQIIFNGETIADTQKAYRVLETSHPPTYYLPPEDINPYYLGPSARETFCEWKGSGNYYSVTVGDKTLTDVAWYYATPTAKFAAIKNYVAFYAAPMDRCLVDGEVVIPQPGQFYGGWITADIIGPFKGEPGSWGW